MSDTTDLREQVARAIDDLVVTVCEGGIDEVADVAIAKVIEELISEADEYGWHLIRDVNDMVGDSLADWLRAQAAEPGDKKIYIGFKDKPKDKDKEDDK